MKTKTPIQESLERFREKFYLPNFPNGWKLKGTISEYQNFLSKELSLAEERGRKKIKSKIIAMKKEHDNKEQHSLVAFHRGHRLGYSEALSNILEAIKKGNL